VENLVDTKNTQTKITYKNPPWW